MNERQGAASKQKSRQSRKKAGYYKQQSLVTSRNKNRRAIKVKRKLTDNPKQPTISAFTVHGDVQVSAVLTAKQARRKARNRRQHDRIVAARTVLPVQAMTAE